MKIAFFDIQGWEKSHLKKSFKGHKLEFFNEPLNLDNVNKVKAFDVISVFIYSKLDKKIISKLNKAKMIATRSTGFDHIDLNACKKKNIDVYNVPFYGENTVAEHTFALILSLARNVHKSYVRTLKNDFSINGLKGFDLKGKTIGVIGAGHIGLNVIKIAKGFGMNVLAYDHFHDNFISEVLDYNYCELDDLLKKSDIISLHVPYCETTHHLINKKNIKKCKKGALLINTARGEVVDTNALIWALDSKVLSGAGLDVIEGEQYIREEKEILYEDRKHIKELVRDHILLSKDNVVYTPHIAFYSTEALFRILNTTISNIKGETNYTVFR